MLGSPKLLRRPRIANYPNNLKRAIEASGRKRKWLAGELGVSRVTLHRYEHGECPVPEQRRELLATLLPETELQFTEEEMLDAA